MWVVAEINLCSLTVTWRAEFYKILQNTQWLSQDDELFWKMFSHPPTPQYNKRLLSQGARFILQKFSSSRERFGEI